MLLRSTYRASTLLRSALRNMLHACCTFAPPACYRGSAFLALMTTPTGTTHARNVLHVLSLFCSTKLSPNPAPPTSTPPPPHPGWQGTPSLEALKLLYYSLMIRFHLHEANYLEVCRCYR